MNSKKEKVIVHVRHGEYKEALRICKSWNLPITKEESDTLRRGYECMIYPRFYEEIGRDVQQEIDSAIEILKRIYEV